MSVEIPIPTTFDAAVWLAIGAMFARAFGKNLDREIKKTDFYKNLPGIYQWILARLLDFLHHWWVGALIMIYSPWPWLYWAGVGLLVDDIPDIPARLKKYFPKWL